MWRLGGGWDIQPIGYRGVEWFNLEARYCQQCRALGKKVLCHAKIQFSKAQTVPWGRMPMVKTIIWYHNWICRHWNHCRCCLLANDLPSSSLQVVARTVQRFFPVSCFNQSRAVSFRTADSLLFSVILLFVVRRMHCCTKLYA